MNRQELIKLAESGNTQAIEELTKQLFQEKDIGECSYWAQKGAEAGSVLCMQLAVNLLTMDAHVSLKVAGSYEAVNSLKKLLDAEKWANVLNHSGILKEPVNLSSTYAEMVWCNYMLAIETKDISYYHEAIKRYEQMTEKCQSEVTFAYLRSLKKTGRTQGLLEREINLVDNHDNTLKDYMIETLCAGIAVAYLEGNGVAANYETADHYAKLAKQCNPENELAVLFENGQARQEFERRHGKKDNSSMTYSGNAAGGGSKGCYVATAVYGSYDCPEVWTLRRFRDNVLDTSWYGRAFIKVYYMISPKLVKYFGNKKWFNRFCKGKLDVFVKKLKDNGFEDTKYYD